MQAVATAREHLRIDVGEHDESTGAHLAQHAEREITGAARHIQRLLARAQVRARQREALPQTMRAGRHEIVHHVVVAGD